MALIKCPECGREISTFAEACPGCGYPMKRHGGPLRPPHNPAQEPVRAKARKKAKRTGKSIQLGAYEDAPLSWQVLETVGERALVICKSVIECKPFHAEQVDVTWAKSDLRAWLNGEFVDAAFADEERERILETDLVNRDNGEYGISGGADTTDLVFVLDVHDAEKMFKSDAERIAPASEHALDNGAAQSDKEGAYWWLRTPGSLGFLAAFVFPSGAICTRGNAVDAFEYGVRPAMWIQL